ncbi:MAG TPA: cupin domain-containing protein [Candidatus Dormibacteraeota bacterium]
MTEPASAFARIAELRPHAVWDGVVARTLIGEKLMFAVVDLAPDSVVGEHSHPHEQAGVCLRGSLVFTIGGETRELHAGDAYMIPGGVPHTAQTGPQGATVVDAFSPPREDWEKLERLEPSAPAWP